MIGRFSQVDQFKGDVFYPGTLNPYQYGFANPTRYIDPSGRQSREGFIASCLAIAVGIPDPGFTEAICILVLFGIGYSAINFTTNAVTPNYSSRVEAFADTFVDTCNSAWDELVDLFSISLFSTADWHAVSVPKPIVNDPYLQNLVNNMYRETSKIGPNGSTADAVRHEALTGEPVGETWHEQAARNSLKGLDNWIDDRYKELVFGELSVEEVENLVNEIEAAEALAKDLIDALDKWDNRNQNGENSQGDD